PRSDASIAAPAGLLQKLDFMDLALLRRERVVDLLDQLVGELLNFRRGLVMLVLAHAGILLELLQKLHSFAAYVTHRHAALLGILVRELGKLLAPFRGERRDRQPDQRTVDHWIEAEVRLADRLVDGGDVALVPDLHGNHARL